MTLFYADTIAQPPPVPTGTPFTTYQDPMGDLWVAKGGVRGGQWRRARNVLRARCHLSANWTAGAAGWNMVSFNSITYDEYGTMSVPATTPFVCPLAGFWRAMASAQLAAVYTRMLVCISVNSGDTTRGSDVNASLLGGAVTDILNLNSGNTVGLYLYLGTASSVVYSGASNFATFLALEYHAPPIGT